MKKLIMVFVCLMAIVSVSAQNWSMEAKHKAVKSIKCKLKAPSTFILTDCYGNKIPVSKILATYVCEKNIVDSIIYGKDDSVIDSIEYICDKKTGEVIDSLTYTSIKTVYIDSIEYYKWVYPACYKCTFYYEAQNSFGGMVQNFAVVYITKGAYVSKFTDYETRHETATMVKIGKKNVFKRTNTQPVKVINTYVETSRCPIYNTLRVKKKNGHWEYKYGTGISCRDNIEKNKRNFKTYDVGAMIDEINRLNTEIQKKK